MNEGQDNENAERFRIHCWINATGIKCKIRLLELKNQIDQMNSHMPSSLIQQKKKKEKKEKKESLMGNGVRGDQPCV